MQLVAFSKAGVLILFIAFLVARNVDAQPTFVRSRCNSTSGNYTSDSDYKKSLNLLLTQLTSKSSMNGNSETGSTEKVYGLFYCRGDLQISVCNTCVQTAATKILSECPNQKDSVVWYQECTLRYYANNSAAYLEEDGKFVGLSSGDNVENPAQFLIQLTMVLTPLINKTAYGSSKPGYATGERNITKLQTLHCLVQCSPFVTGDHCDQCLKNANSELGSCCKNGSNWVMLYNPSCQLRYDLLPFYNLPSSQGNAAPTPAQSPTSVSVAKNASSGNNATYYVTRVAVPVGLGLLIAAICLWQRRNLLSLIKTSSNQATGRNTIEGPEVAKFSFRALKKATGNFSEESILGKGGYGVVYKGILNNGDVVAIKRLNLEKSEQSNTEFSNEVVIVAKLQHRNLVRLFGYCEKKKERLLVYEYVPNLSLDKFLFDSSNSEKLDWGTRYKIILGIARGLQYLHHEAHLNIIHRDLKTPNILLDAEMNPKIADFGLAKLIQMDHTHGDTTRIAGTMGYMSPEYLFMGQFSTKSDVYSFGVILLEIVSGQQVVKSDKPENYKQLLQRAWRLWGEGKPEELLHPTLKNVAAEAVRCIQVALLCVQQDATSRPPMQTVLLYLNSDLVSIPRPLRPAVMYDTTEVAGTGSSSSNTKSKRGNPLFHSRTNESSTTESMITDLFPR